MFFTLLPESWTANSRLPSSLSSAVLGQLRDRLPNAKPRVACRPARGNGYLFCSSVASRDNLVRFLGILVAQHLAQDGSIALKSAGTPPAGPRSRWRLLASQSSASRRGPQLSRRGNAPLAVSCRPPDPPA